MTEDNEKESNKDDKKTNLTTDHLKDDWLGNVGMFNKIIKDPDKVREISKITESEYPEIYAYQKKLTRMVLRSFPGIERQFRREDDLEFQARILRIPFLRRSNNIQHDCVQKYLAERQGEINIATGSKGIMADMFYVDMPILAPEGRGDALLFKQKELLEEAIPPLQGDCLIKAQPIAVAHKVYDYRGRWLIWRMLFDRDKAEKIGRDAEKVPLYAQRLTDFRLAHLFPFAGTTDGELSLIVIEDHEENSLQDSLDRLEEDFSLETTHIDVEIRISWESIVDLGILPYAAEPHLPQIGKIFTKTLKEMILEDTIIDFGTFTEKDNVSEQKNKNGRIRELSKLIAYDIMNRGLENVFRVVQKVPESLMKHYEIRGRGERT